MKSWKQSQAEFNERAGRNNNLLVVDGFNLAFRWKHNKRKPFASDYVRTVQSLAQSYGARRVIIVTDKGKSIFRKEIFPEYKANRDERFANKTDEEKEDDRIFFEYYHEALKLCETTFPTFYQKGVEADDLAGVIVKVMLEEDTYDTIWLVSTDGDWDTLLADKGRVKRFSYKTRREYTTETMYEEHGVDTVEQFISLKAIQGDLGDNIRGVDGIGPKRCYGLLREYGDVIGILDSIPLPGKQMFIKNLNESYDLIERNIQLVDLPSFCEEAVEAAGYLEEFVQELRKLV